MSFNRFAIFFFAVVTAVFGACEDLDSMEQCYETLETMQATVRDVLLAGEGCMNDAECVMFDPSNGCYGACPVAVNMRDISWINMTIMEADNMYCQTFAEDCWYDEPESCVAVRPACEMGRCTAVPF